VTCPVVLPAGRCLGDGGTARDAVAPVAGDLVITEVMADPSKVLDDLGEWFEVLVTADVDLNGVQLGTTPGTVRHTLSDDDCLPVTAGTRLIFAHGDTTNGGLSRVDAQFPFTLSNSGGGLFIGHGGAVLDLVAFPSATPGASSQVDPESETDVLNDTAFCPTAAGTVYGDGDRGTPGLPNLQCPTVIPAGRCLGEGDVERDLVKPAVDDLVITEWMANPTKVGDTAGEWVEVFVARDVDLNGVSLEDANDKTTLSGTTCLRHTAGTYLVFARGTMNNGGLPRVDYVFDWDVVNSSAGGAFLRLKLDGTDVLDEVTYMDTGSGASTSLITVPPTAASNGDPLNLCTATAVYGLGDKGSPGVENPTTRNTDGSCP
jgi:hypothetical protein